MTTLPHIEPLPLVRRPVPFSHPDWLFELKYDGFRALAYVDRDAARLVSRNGHTFTTFFDLSESLRRAVPHRAILDGEIACLDAEGRSQFNQLLFRRAAPLFCAFDLLWLDGRDLRPVPLIERKQLLRNIIPQHLPHLLYVITSKVKANGFLDSPAKKILKALLLNIGRASIASTPMTGSKLRTGTTPKPLVAMNYSTRTNR